MHDWHLAEQVLKTVLDYAKENNLKKISKIDLELGSITEHGEEIMPENLKHNIKALSQKTILKDAEINIKRTKGDIWKLVSIED
ncbi:MAG: hypothetical protein GF387_02110 [Candidatus Portnoybacteria bacterium]|nr:hypothetical protein [Candidatus Portnoybacteria bacterium]